METAKHVCGAGCGHITRFTDAGRTRDPRAGAKRRLVRTQILEQNYGRQLRRVAVEVDRIVRGFPIGDPTSIPGLQDTLRRYADVLTPWAETTGGAMVAEIEARDKKAWGLMAQRMGAGMAREIAQADTGRALRDMLASQVELIRSLPIEAGERVHELTLKGLVDSTRASEIAKEILRTGEVTASRAMLIARTEVARTASGLTQARSLSIGAETYFWRTSEDESVRESHRKMDGVPVRWDTPPRLSDGTVTHAGQTFNCRCWPEPILPSRF